MLEITSALILKILSCNKRKFNRFSFIKISIKKRKKFLFPREIYTRSCCASKRRENFFSSSFNSQHTHEKRKKINCESFLRKISKKARFVSRLEKKKRDFAIIFWIRKNSISKKLFCRQNSLWKNTETMLSYIRHSTKLCASEQCTINDHSEKVENKLKEVVVELRKSYFVNC